MFKTVSSPQPRGGLGGSGALSHVYIGSPPLRCNIPGARGLYYDDANKLLLSPTSNQVFSWKTGLYPPLDAPILDSISEGPILSIRYSLDGKVVGIQRSNQEIEFRNRETGASFKGRCRVESDSILGFFWTDCPTCDVVFIKASGLDLFSYEPELNMLRFVETKRLNVSWYSYTHESRLVLLASGMQCKTFTGFQFSSGGIIRLPKFEMTMAIAEVNKKPVLASEDVQIVTIYGRIYCLQADRLAMQLHLYRFYRDAVVHQGSLPIYSAKIAISVVDNVLLVHQVDAKVVLLYDIFADSRAPISAPLPLLVRSLSCPNSSITGSKQTVTSSQLDEATSENEEVAIYGNDWTFLFPDLICDVSHGILWRIRLDLEAIAASSSEVPSVLEFLQRRRLESNKAKQLCMGIMRSMILERRPISMVARAFDVLAVSYSHSMKLGTSGIQTQGKSIRQDSNSRMENEPQESKPRDVANEPRDVNLASSVNRLSSSSVSESEENQSLERLKTDSGKPFETFASGNCQVPTARKKKNHTNAETSQSFTERIPLQSEILETNGNSVGSDVSDQNTSQHAGVAISPDEMYSCVFSLVVVEEEMAGDPTYLVAVIVEYYRSAALEKFKVHSSIHVMTIQLLARSERYAEVGQFVISKILEPSKEVALQLLESGRHNLQTRKLGMDMLRQLSYHDDYVSVLLQDGYYLEALRYVRKNKVNTIRPSLFLEAAFASNDSQHLAAVLRFFLDYMPDFRSTSDHINFSRVLNEMNQTIAA